MFYLKRVNIVRKKTALKEFIISVNKTMHMLLSKDTEQDLMDYSDDLEDLYQFIVFMIKVLSIKTHCLKFNDN